jgi:hypothetical protein
VVTVNVRAPSLFCEAPRVLASGGRGYGDRIRAQSQGVAGRGYSGGTGGRRTGVSSGPGATAREAAGQRPARLQRLVTSCKSSAAVGAYVPAARMCAHRAAESGPCVADQRLLPVQQHVSVLEWLEAQGKMRRVPHVGPARPHGVEPPERPPGAELLFMHKIQDQIRHPPSGAWTPAELANGVARLFATLPLAEQQRYRSEAREGMERYEAELAHLATQRGRSDQNEVIKPRRKKDQKKRGDNKGVVVTLEILETVFHMPLHKACKALGVCATAMKRVCRKLGVKKWPYRDAARWW